MASDSEVIADLVVNVDDKDVQNLSSLETSTEKIRVNIEAASRATSNFSEHLTSLSQQGQSLPRGNEAFSDGGDSRSNTLGFSGRPGDGGGRGDFNGQPLSIEPIQSRLDNLKDSNHERYENLLAQRGFSSDSDSNSLPRTYSRDSGGGSGPRGPKTSPGKVGETLTGVSDLASSFLGELAPGRTLPGGLETLGSKVQDLSSGAGKLGGLTRLISPAALGALGVAGGGLVAGAGAMQLVQAGGAQIQNLANIGSVNGGSAWEGLGYESQIRGLALNPFISTEQSRQIIMSALSGGYTGDEFDTVTEFMADNLRSMNMSVAESTALLNRNVREGGQAIENLSSDLATIKELSKDGVLSQEDRQALYSQTSGSLIDNNVGGQQASDEALIAQELFSDNASLAGAFSDILTNPSQHLVLQAGQLEGIRGRTPQQTLQELGNNNKLSEGVYGVLRRYAEQFRKHYEQDSAAGTQYFQGALKSLGINMNPRQAEDLLIYLLDEDNANAIQDVRTEIDETQFDVEGRSFKEKLSGFSGTVGRSLSTVGAAIGDTVSTLDFWNWGEQGFLSTNSDVYRNTREQFRKSETAGASTSPYSIKALTDLYESYGANNVNIVDDEGNIVRAEGDRRSQKQFYDDISSGKYKVQVNGGESFSLRESKGRQAEGSIEGQATNSVTDTRVNVEVSPTPELRRLLRMDTRTSNQERTDAGFGNSTRNNPEPGDK